MLFGIENSYGKTLIRGKRLRYGSFDLVFSSTTALSSPLIFIHDDIDSVFILPSDLAIKSAELSQSSSLKNENQILCNLISSPYIVGCFGDEITKSANGNLYYNILMENCTSDSLASMIENSGGLGLPEREVRYYVRDIIRGLCYIHNHGYVHCNIKPANILLTPNSFGCFTTKLADFGLATKINCREDECERCLSLKGTFRYMSLELEMSKTQGRFSDVWALGCVLVDMMTGKPVWGGSKIDEDIADLLCRIAYSPELPEFTPNISEEGKSFLENCFQTDVNFRSLAQMLIQHSFLSQDG